MTWVAIGVGVGGAVLGAVGSMRKGKQEKRAAQANAELANFQADDATLRGAIEESRYRRYVASVVGGQKVAFGQRNVAVSGTALDMLADTAMQGEENVQMIRANAAREAWGYRNQANESSRFAKQAMPNAYGEAAGTLLTSGAQAYGMWQGR